MSDFVLYNMDVFEGLKQIEDASVDCIMTSPPYWGLRDYGVPGQIGLEAHPKEWIEKMVEVSRELWRVLKPAGSYWLNVGDTYFAKRSKDEVVDEYYGPGRNGGHPRGMESDGSAWLQPKQKMLMPHRLAIALQDDGWILRNDCVWHKPSHMPSSVRDRLTNSFEFLFHFVIQKKYYYDLDAIREPHSAIDRPPGNKEKDRENKLFSRNPTAQQAFNPSGKNPGDAWKYEREWEEQKDKVYGNDDRDDRRSRVSAWMYTKEATTHPLGKNPGDFWSINPAPYPEAHFACFPPALVERPLLATCPRQVCVACGKAREKIIDIKSNYKKREKAHVPNNCLTKVDSSGWNPPTMKLRGFSDCGCKKGFFPGIVLDPFVGSGTTLLVAQRLGLRGIGIELNPDYIPLIKKRLLGDAKQQSLNPNKLKVVA